MQTSTPVCASRVPTCKPANFIRSLWIEGLAGRAYARPVVYNGAAFVTYAPFWRTYDQRETRAFCEESKSWYRVDNAANSTGLASDGDTSGFGSIDPFALSPNASNTQLFEQFQQSAVPLPPPPEEECPEPVVAVPYQSGFDCNLRARLQGRINAGNVEPYALAFSLERPYDIAWRSDAPCSSDVAPALDVGSGVVLFSCDGSADEPAYVLALDGVTRNVTWIWRANETDPVQDLASVVVTELWNDMREKLPSEEPWIQRRAFAPLALSGAGHVIWSGPSMLACLDVVFGKLMWTKRGNLLTEPLATPNNVTVAFTDRYTRVYDVWTGAPLDGELPDASDSHVCCGVYNPACVNADPQRCYIEGTATQCRDNRPCPEDQVCASGPGVCVRDLTKRDVGYPRNWCANLPQEPQPKVSYNGNLWGPELFPGERERLDEDLRMSLQTDSIQSWGLHGSPIFSRVPGNQTLRAASWSNSTTMRAVVALSSDNSSYHAVQGSWLTPQRIPYVEPCLDLRRSTIYYGIGDKILWHDWNMHASGYGSVRETSRVWERADGNGAGTTVVSVDAGPFNITQWGSPAIAGDFMYVLGSAFSVPTASDQSAPAQSYAALFSLKLPAPNVTNETADLGPDADHDADVVCVPWQAGLALTDPNMSGDFSVHAAVGQMPLCYMGYPGFTFIPGAPYIGPDDEPVTPTSGDPSFPGSLGSAPLGSGGGSASHPTSDKPSQGVIIGLSITLGALLIAAVAAALIVGRRRRRTRARADELHPSDSTPSKPGAEASLRHRSSMRRESADVRPGSRPRINFEVGDMTSEHVMMPLCPDSLACGPSTSCSNSLRAEPGAASFDAAMLVGAVSVQIFPSSSFGDLLERTRTQASGAAAPGESNYGNTVASDAAAQLRWNATGPAGISVQIDAGNGSVRQRYLHRGDAASLLTINAAPGRLVDGAMLTRGTSGHATDRCCSNASPGRGDAAGVSGAETRVSVALAQRDVSSGWTHKELNQQLDLMCEQGLLLANMFRLAAGSRGASSASSPSDADPLPRKASGACAHLDELPTAGRCGGQGLVAFATIDRGASSAILRSGSSSTGELRHANDAAESAALELWQTNDVAIKFHFSERAYVREKAFGNDPRLQDCLPTVLYSSANDPNGTLLAPNGRRWPPFFVLPRGEPLDEYITKRSVRSAGGRNAPSPYDGQLPRTTGVDPITCIQILMHLAERLEAMHAAGLVHCDVKPANAVFLDEWQVIDLGHAQWAGTRVPPALTPEFAAPEQVRLWLELEAASKAATPLQEEETLITIDPAFDVWALGLIGYRLLADPSADPVMRLGKRRMWALLHGPNPVPWEVNPLYYKTQACFRGLGEEFVYWIQRMLSRKAELRPTMTECVDGWRAALRLQPRIKSFAG